MVYCGAGRGGAGGGGGERGGAARQAGGGGRGKAGGTPGTASVGRQTHLQREAGEDAPGLGQHAAEVLRGRRHGRGLRRRAWVEAAGAG